MKFRLAAGAALLTVLLSAIIGVASVNAEGEGHTPTVVCHWVPAGASGAHSIPGPDGGSYNVIVVDDDAASGNKRLQAHADHEHDIIGQDGTCGTANDDGGVIDED